MREIADERLPRSPVRFVGHRPEDVNAHSDTEPRNAVKVSGTKLRNCFKSCENQKYENIPQGKSCQYKAREDFAPKPHVKQYLVSEWSENRATAKSNGSDEPEIFSIRAGAR